MKAHLKEEWLKALRSGDYSQGTECLVDKNQNYCCLGVLAEIADPERTTDWENCKCFYFGGVDKDFTFSRAREQVELVGQNLPIKELARMNDEDNLTFNEIANWIEEHIPAE